MLLYVDFETIFANPDIMEQFNLTKNLYDQRLNDEDTNWKYKDVRKKLKMMIDKAK